MKDSSSSELDNTTNSKKSSTKKSHPKGSLPCSLYTSRLSICLLSVFAISFVLLQIRSLQTPPRTIIHQWEKIINISCLAPNFHKNNGVLELKSLTSKLQESVTFLPLKDLRYAHVPMKGHTWFMSSMYDTHEEGEVQYQQFPTKASSDRVLCLKGRDTHDGSWNSYALAWRDTLPQNATLMDGMTFVSYNHYDYYNIWHGLSAMMPFVAWHIKNQCSAPRRWILYHWGEIRTSMAPWLSTLLEASFGVPIRIETFDEIYRNKTRGDSYQAVCFEEAVVMRHNEGGMSRLKRMEVYDLMRCKSRMYCNVGSRSYNDSSIGLTMLMREGGRSFKNSSAVIGIFEKECKKVKGCRLIVAYPHNLTFCEQVKLMSGTDIVISAHGAQLSNMILMDRNSSVMELFPKGWLELAGVGQYVHHWLASWSGMRHEGAWRDPEPSNPCKYPDKDVRCMSAFKNGKIGHNESYFADWARRVLKDVALRKLGQVGRGMTKISSPVSGLCGCD